MTNLSDYIYDLCQNSIHAQAKTIILTISFSKDLTIIIKDDGLGMDRNVLNKVKDFTYTTNKHRHVGLGLSMIYDLVMQTEGTFELKSKKDHGTTLILKFNHKHIDFPEFGNLGSIISDLYMYEKLSNIRLFINKNHLYMFDLKHVLNQKKTYDMKQCIEENINQKLRNIGVEV